MARRSLDQLGRLQTAVMEIAWELQEATVQQVLDRLAGRKKLAYTTVLSAMQKLERLGWLKHRADGRTYIYVPTRSRTDEGRRSLRNLLGSVFDDDPLRMAQHLLEDERLGPEELSELRRMVDRRRRELTQE